MADMQGVYLHDGGIQLSADNANNLLLQITNYGSLGDCLQIWHPNVTEPKYLFWQPDNFSNRYTGDGVSGRVIETYGNTENAITLIHCITDDRLIVLYRDTTLFCENGEFMIEFKVASTLSQGFYIYKPHYLNYEGDEYEWWVI